MKQAALAPLALSLSASAEATEYSSSREVFDTIDRLEASVAARLRAVARARPRAVAFTASLLADHEVFRKRRQALRRDLGLPSAADAFDSPGAVDGDLQSLKQAQDALVYAHAEGLPAVGDPRAIHDLASHMVEHSRHLTLIDLWLSEEQSRD